MSIEDFFVRDVYDAIAHHFDHTRHSTWPCVERFLKDLPLNSKIADIGCGNGKNMTKSECLWYGCDSSQAMVEICQRKKLNVIQGDILDIPYRDDYFDATICVAVIHHLSTKEKRKKAIDELCRITKKGGKIFILVWAFEQDKYSKHKFHSRDNFIPWKNNNQRIIGLRYYHVFDKAEFAELCQADDIFFEKGNWGTIIQKE
jgi:SAM-dependent methyltransferase